MCAVNGSLMSAISTVAHIANIVYPGCIWNFAETIRLRMTPVTVSPKPPKPKTPDPL